MSSMHIWLEQPQEAQTIITGSEYNHLANVLRAKVGDQVIAISGDAYNRIYQIAQITNKSITLQFLAKELNQANPERKFTVYLALIKPDALAFAVQKLNEIGVSDLKLFVSEYTAVSVKQIKLERLQEIARQSCKQCGRSVPLQISFLTNLFAENLSKAVFLDEKANTPAVVKSANAVIVGPEGGFTPAERAKLAQKAQVVTLGKRILRAETAAIVGASKWCI